MLKIRFHHYAKGIDVAMYILRYDLFKSDNDRLGYVGIATLA